MLSYEEFEANCNRMDAKLAAEIARQSKFMEALEKALIEISIQHFPETEPYKHLFIDALAVKAHQRAVLLNERLDWLACGGNSDDIEFYNQSQVPQRDVSQEEQQFLEDTLKTLPPEQHATFIQLNAERLAIEAQDREFVFLCYEKAKELILKFFPEIIDFSGNTLRDIDHSAYLQMDEWVYDFNYIAGDYMDDYKLE